MSYFVLDHPKPLLLSSISYSSSFSLYVSLLSQDGIGVPMVARFFHKRNFSSKRGVIAKSNEISGVSSTPLKYGAVALALHYLFCFFLRISLKKNEILCSVFSFVSRYFLHSCVGWMGLFDRTKIRLQIF